MAYEQHTFTFQDCAFTNNEIKVEVFRKSTRISIGENDIFGIENEDLKLLIDFCQRRLEQIESDKFNILDEIPLTKFLSNGEILTNFDKNKYAYIFRILLNNTIVCIKNTSGLLFIGNQCAVIYKEETQKLLIVPLFVFLNDYRDCLLNKTQPVCQLVRIFNNETNAYNYAKKLTQKYKDVTIFNLSDELNK